MTGNLVNFTL